MRSCINKSEYDYLCKLSSLFVERSLFERSSASERRTRHIELQSFTNLHIKASKQTGMVMFVTHSV